MTALRALCALILASILPTTAHAAGEGYPVPPSIYGQIGNPFWASGAQPAPPSQATAPAVFEPEPEPAPVMAMNTSAEMPPPPPVARPLKPQSTKPIPARSIAPAPKPMAAPQTVASHTAPDDGYRVPATSKYAARLNALRAADTSAQPASAPVAAAPSPTPAEDHVFMPGEHYTDVSQEPRLYSLHRQWGMTPDKITVDPTPNGGLLVLNDMPSSGGADADKDSDKDADASAQTNPQPVMP